MATARFSWQPKKCTIEGQSVRKKCVKKMSHLSLSMTWVMFGGTVMSHWLSLTSWYRHCTHCDVTLALTDVTVVSEETPLTRPSGWSPDISGVYDPIPTKFCEQVGLWAKGAEKYPNIGYLDNGCLSNQKTSSELIKRLKGYGILTVGAMGW